MACLEHATELDPQVRSAVEKRAAALFPPQDMDDVMALGEVGPIVLEFLPVDSRDAGEQARYTIAIASTVGTDQAIPIMAAYRHSRDVVIRTQLANSWHRFDTKRYGEEVISHLSVQDLFFSVSSLQEVEALHRMGGRPMIRVDAPIPAEQLRENIDPSTLWQLWLTRDTYGGDLGWLACFHNLRVLHLTDKDAEVDVAGLAGMDRLRTIHSNCRLVVGVDKLPPSVAFRAYH
jgi:hypothetical protein